jgi:hypothetical protein
MTMAEPGAKLMMYFGAGVIIIAGTFALWIYLHWRPKRLARARLRPADEIDDRPSTDEPGRPYAALSAAELLISLLLLLLLFAFVDGPIWLRPFDIERAVLWSYAPIPVVVLGILWWRERLAAASWLLGVLQLGGAKFGVTLSFMVCVWALSPPPEQRDNAPAVARGDATAEAPPQAPSATPWPAEQRFEVAGQVVGEHEEAIAGALVFVAEGLEQVAFEVPTEPLFIELTDGHVRPAVAVARTYQPLRARATDGRMHNLVASPGDNVLFNVPLLASGKVQQIRARRSEAFVPLLCMVHGGVERGQLLLTANPFNAISDGAGKFAWADVPKLPLRIRAWHPTGGESEVRVDPSAAASSLRLVLR